MDPDTARSLRQLLSTRPVASLATLHRGEPALSMVPFVLPAGDTRLYIHVSALATHTRDLQLHARVALLVMAEPDEQTLAQALPRVALQADATVLERAGPGYEAARAAYLLRFAQAAPIFELGDFSLVALQPVAAPPGGRFRPCPQPGGRRAGRLAARLRGGLKQTWLCHFA